MFAVAQNARGTTKARNAAVSYLEIILKNLRKPRVSRNENGLRGDIKHERTRTKLFSKRTKLLMPNLRK